MPLSVPSDGSRYSGGLMNVRLNKNKNISLFKNVSEEISVSIVSTHDMAMTTSFRRI